MKKYLNYQKILSLILFFFACLIILRVEVKADNLGQVYETNATPKCTFSTDSTIATKSRKLNAAYYTGSFYITSFYNSSNSKFNLVLLDDKCVFKQAVAETSAVDGTGTDISDTGTANVYAVVTNHTNKVVKTINLKNSTLSFNATYTQAMQYDGLTYDSVNKRYYVTNAMTLYTIPNLSSGKSPTKVISLPKKSPKETVLTLASLDSDNNLYVATNDANNKTAYILVYSNAKQPTYKYAISIPHPNKNFTLTGITYKSGTLHLVYTDGAKNVGMYTADISKFEDDYNSRIADIKLSVHKEVVIPQNNPFDFTNLFVKITYLSGKTDEVKLDSSNSTVSGFNSGLVGKQVVTINYKGYSFPCEIEVLGVAVPVSNISLDVRQASLKIGANKKINVNFEPSNATNKGVTWSTANPEIATVNAEGVVHAVATGETTVTATSVDGGKTATAKIIVLKELLRVDLEVTEPIVIRKYSDFDYSNLYIKTTFSDGEEVLTKLDETNCEIEGFDNEKEGQQTITVIYEDNRYETEITVSSLETREVEPKEEPKKKEVSVKQLDPITTGIEATKDKGSNGIIIAILLISGILVGIASILIVIGLKFKKPPMQ